MQKKISLVLGLWLLSFISQAQYAKLYPTNWFTGMKWNKVQLLVYGEYDGFNKEKVKINYPGVELVKVTPLENGKYMDAATASRFAQLFENSDLARFAGVQLTQAELSSAIDDAQRLIEQTSSERRSTIPTTETAEVC